MSRFGMGFTSPGTTPVTTLVKQADATSTGASVTAPADIIAGDLLVLADVAGGPSLPAAVTPSGWTLIASTTAGTTLRGMLHYKIATGDEASSIITGMNGSTNNKVLLVFRPNAPIQSATPNTFGAEGTTNNPSPQTVIASAGTPPLVVLGLYGAGVAVDPRTFTVGGSAAKDGEVSASGNRLYTAWKIYNSSPANVVIDMDDESLQVLQSGYIAVA